MRKMTISTCGVVPGIRFLAGINSQIGLAVSLHSCFDEKRDKLVPMNKKYPLAVLMEACREYCARTRRRITFEMALTEETCTREEAVALTELLKGLTAHVNVIPVNPITVRNPITVGQIPSDPVRGKSVQGEPVQLSGVRPTRQQVSRFVAVIEQARIPVSVREEKGADIEAACGQLRRRWGNECEPIIKM
jgi:23S rRNA (adenine2503-C2)-methyltransferase